MEQSIHFPAYLTAGDLPCGWIYMIYRLLRRIVVVGKKKTEPKYNQLLERERNDKKTREKKNYCNLVILQFRRISLHRLFRWRRSLLESIVLARISEVDRSGRSILPSLAPLGPRRRRIDHRLRHMLEMA